MNAYVDSNLVLPKNEPDLQLFHTRTTETRDSKESNWLLYIWHLVSSGVRTEENRKQYTRTQFSLVRFLICCYFVRYKKKSLASMN